MSTKWWTVTLVVAPVINKINNTVIRLQNWFIIISQQIKIGFFKDLLIGMFKVKGIIEIDDDEEDIENKFYIDGD